MIFPTASTEKRPVRLRETTRQWASEYMHGSTLSTPCVTLDDVPDFDRLTDLQKYDLAIRRIAEEAPLRTAPEERIAGSATLRDAILHCVPATYQGKHVFRSVSHLTIRYDKVLREGLDAYAREISSRLADPALTDAQAAFLHSLENVIASMRIWHGRYAALTKETRPDIYRMLRQVPFSPARNFAEAVQSIWFVFSFVRLCGNWPGIGRLDLLLGDYLKKDLREGLLDETEAREILVSFFIKGCEWIQTDTPLGSGDAQHYQNIVLSGIDETGAPVTNEATFLILDIIEELGISDFPITIRLSRHSSEALKEKAARVMRHGGGVVAVYNEDLILQALKNTGYPFSEAAAFANDGCWEVQIPGKTDFMYIPFDALQIFNTALGLHDETDAEYRSVEELYAAFRSLLGETIGEIYKKHVANAYFCENGVWHARSKVCPTSVISLFEDDCIARAQSYYDLGTRYTVRAPHIGGAPDVANSLYAIQKLVFEEKKVSFRELVVALKNNWEDNEPLRLYVKNHYVYYGNDNDEADRWHTRILNDFAALVEQCGAQSGNPVKFIPGVSTFGRQINWLPNRSATAFGYKKGDILSGNDSPVPGTDIRGVTAAIKSYCKADLVRQTNGAALDVKIFPESLSGENGVTALTSLMDGFLTLGGFFLQLDAVDRTTLLEAQKNPQKFKTLSVRVSGWNARFVTLNREWQNMIIERTSYESK